MSVCVKVMIRGVLSELLLVVQVIIMSWWGCGGWGSGLDYSWKIEPEEVEEKEERGSQRKRKEKKGGGMLF